MAKENERGRNMAYIIRSKGVSSAAVRRLAEYVMKLLECHNG
jgi:hypothetical protein